MNCILLKEVFVAAGGLLDAALFMISKLAGILHEGPSSDFMTPFNALLSPPEGGYSCALAAALRRAQLVYGHICPELDFVPSSSVRKSEFESEKNEQVKKTAPMSPLTRRAR